MHAHHRVLTTARDDVRRRYVLLGDLRANAGYDVPACLERAGGTQVFSFGGGTGVRMGNHGFAWIGLIAGRKVWYVAPPDRPRPANPKCKNGDETIQQLVNVSHCIQRPRDVMVVPTAWWHATCNIDPYTFGIGGQDSCDLVICPGFEDADHMDKQFCPTGAQRSARCFANRDEFRTQTWLQRETSVEMEAAAKAGDDAWDRWLDAGGEQRRRLDARYARIEHRQE